MRAYMVNRRTGMHYEIEADGLATLVRFDWIEEKVQIGTEVWYTTGTEWDVIIDRDCASTLAALGAGRTQKRADWERENAVWRTVA